MRQLQKTKKRKTRAELNEEGRERQRQKKHRGRPAGSRTSLNEQTTKSGKTPNVKDVRIGSKKPIDLIVDSSVQQKQNVTIKPTAEQKKLSPEKKLELLENDQKLDALLERLENGETLTKEEHKYVDTMLDRIDELMAQLGIELEDDTEDEEHFQTKQPDIMQLLKRKD